MNFLNLPTGSRRYLEIARHLAGEIEKGEYAAGERLPPERELAQTLDVSRTTVREALLALERSISARDPTALVPLLPLDVLVETELASKITEEPSAEFNRDASS